LQNILNERPLSAAAAALLNDNCPNGQWRHQGAWRAARPDVGVASPSERKVRFGVATIGQKTSGVGAQSRHHASAPTEGRAARTNGACGARIHATPMDRGYCFSALEAAGQPLTTGSPTGSPPRVKGEGAQSTRDGSAFLTRTNLHCPSLAVSRRTALESDKRRNGPTPSSLNQECSHSRIGKPNLGQELCISRYSGAFRWLLPDLSHLV
jgi:hypothetical protein